MGRSFYVSDFQSEAGFTKPSKLPESNDFSDPNVKDKFNL